MKVRSASWFGLGVQKKRRRETYFLRFRTKVRNRRRRTVCIRLFINGSWDFLPHSSSPLSRPPVGSPFVHLSNFGQDGWDGNSIFLEFRTLFLTFRQQEICGGVCCCGKLKERRRKVGIKSLFGVSLNLDSGYFVEKNGVLFFN